MDAAGGSSGGSTVPEREGRVAGKRRRPSGEPPPLPRELGMSGRLWVGLAACLITIVGLALVYEALGSGFDRWSAALLRWLVSLRTGPITTLMGGIDRTLSSRVTTGIIRVGSLATLVVFRRWRHLFTFLFSVVAVEAIGYQLSILVASPRPVGVAIIGSWRGFAFPSLPVATLGVTLIASAFALLPIGRPRWWGMWAAAGVLVLLGLARMYLALDYPSAVVAGVILGVGIPVVVFRLVTPDEVFPISYRRGRTAHLDVGGRRGDAIRKAIREQLGLTVLDVTPVGLEGSGGSTPLRLRVARTSRDPERFLFAKLYAKSHVRADRSYKVGREILYGALEDEAPFQSVRRFVEYEDYTLLLLTRVGIPVPTPFGFVEITPEREYMIVMEFFEGAREIGDAEVDDDVINNGLRLVRQLWNAGLAHRDIKPANLMVRDGSVLLIDVFFVQVRPSPWRQAVDLANMMLVLAVKSDANRVYRRALAYFSEEEIAEAFAATRGVASPSQLRAVLKRDGRDLVSEFRAMAPDRSSVAIQRWSVRRIVLGLLVVAVAVVAFAVVVGNWRVVL
jgi:tRNA A-37 threonylcarbamoyl transferase component Bud32/membrane-associated phospholipid phosphatase